MTLEYRIGDGGCWIWRGRTTPQGYGAHGRTVAHRHVYESSVGQIPDGLELDHLCRVKLCVNPDHLEPVTHAENVRRGTAGAVNRSRMMARTHCTNGHPFEDHASLAPGYRRCLVCARANSRKAWHSNKRACAECGLTKPHAAKGLCGNCYKKARRRES